MCVCVGGGVLEVIMRTTYPTAHTVVEGVTGLFSHTAPHPRQAFPPVSPSPCPPKTATPP